jgi:plastocyanin
VRALAAAVAALLVAPAIASADQTITAVPRDRYDAAEYTIDAGERVTFVNRDITTHDVVGEGFKSPRTDPGQSSTVAGAETLSAGRYEFICSIHPYMKATLVVQGGPTPPPPGEEPPPPSNEPPPPADTTAPGLRVRLIRERRAVLVRITVDEAARLEVRAAGKTRTSGTSGPNTVTMRFRTRRTRRFRAVVKATDAAGNERSVTRRLRPRR